MSRYADKDIRSFFRRTLLLALTAYFLLSAVIFSILNYQREVAVFNQEFRSLRAHVAMEKDKLLYAAIVGSAEMIKERFAIIQEQHPSLMLCSSLMGECPESALRLPIDSNGRYMISVQSRRSLLEAAVFSANNIVLLIMYLIVTVTVLYFLDYRVKSVILKPLSELVDFISNFRRRRSEGVRFFNPKGFVEWHAAGNALRTIIEEIDELEKEVASRTAKDVSLRLAHDIRSPISALNLAIATMQDVTESRRNLILSATNRINDIADELLHNHKSKGRPINRKDVAVICQEVLDEKNLQFGGPKNLRFVANLSAGIGIGVTMEPSHLARILSNVINNGVEAMSAHGGEISLDVTVVGSMVSIRVGDNGCGIPAELLSMLGSRRISQGKSGTESGSGIALLNAKQSLEVCGGGLKIESKLGFGTTVTILLPMQGVTAGAGSLRPLQIGLSEV